MPRLSVIVPTFQRSVVLERCLSALERQSCDASLYEVIVSDDGSTDGSDRIVQNFRSRNPGLRYLRQPNSGANTARNCAVRIASGDLLLFINDDIIPDGRMLEEHLSTHDRFPEDRFAVLGRVTVSPYLPPSRLAPLHLDRAFKSLGSQREFDWRAFFTCNISVKRSLLERGGLFEESIRYHEDLELSERLSHHGLRVIYNPDAVGYHDHFMTEQEFMAVAKREASALAIWSRKSPHLKPVLATLGFESALPLIVRMKHRVAGLIVSAATRRPLLFVARNCPPGLTWLSEAIYLQVYLSIMRASLRRELRRLN